MHKVSSDRDLRSNRLLGALEPASRKRLDPIWSPSISSSAIWSATLAAC